MLSLLCFAALLFYFWYFYYLPIEPVPEPTLAGPLPPNPLSLSLHKKKNTPNTFQFRLGGDVLWEHALPKDPYVFNRLTRDISRKDPCFHYVSTGRVPAKGAALYEYVKRHSDDPNLLSFQKSSYTLREGDVYYFYCSNRQIKSLGICASGSVFKGSRCVDIGPCTGQPNGVRLPDPTRSTHYITCTDEQPTYRYCGNDQIFYRDRCLSQHDVSVFCKLERDPVPFRIDPTTLVTCQEGQVLYKRCAPGMRMFEKNECEPSVCLGQVDGHRVPLPDSLVERFRFSPGYVTCSHDKVDTTHLCPKTWDAWQADEEDLTFLPQVFDGQQCVLPSFCENVHPTHPDVIVPAYDFNKRVKNWRRSDLYDTAAGYVCEQGRKRRQVLPPGSRIKKFKVDDGCVDPASRLPILDRPDRYFDCTLRAEQACPPNQYFDGDACLPRPRHAFTHHDLPLFEMDSLNFESWIEPWRYLPQPTHPRVCSAPDELLGVYDVCSHPECTPYAFLAMVPALSILLPGVPFQCRLDAQERRLVKEPVDAVHRYWDQRVLEAQTLDPEPCVPGQTLRTGHFVWDRTVYATCDPAQPFVFCPSVHTTGLALVFGDYACDTALSNTVDGAGGRAFFTNNEARRLLPYPHHPNPRFKLNKARPWDHLPVDGFEIPRTERVELEAPDPIRVNLRYRVTYPPHIYFEYDDTDQLHRKTTSRGSGFLVHIEKPTALGLNFPTYRPIHHVPEFTP